MKVGVDPCVDCRASNKIKFIRTRYSLFVFVVCFFFFPLISIIFGRFEGELVKIVVSEVLLKLKKNDMVVTDNVFNGVHIVRIGKTTIAKVIVHFLPDVRATSQQQNPHNAISTLNPDQGRWTIKARVTAKGDIHRYNNTRGDGKLFSFDLLDSDGGEIRVTCFNAVVDRFYDAIEVGKVYLISKGSLKPAKKKFNHLNNELEIILKATSAVELCPDEDGSIFSFRPISEIENAEKNSILDIIGIVISVNPSEPFMRKNGTETQIRILNLKDESGKCVELTLWGEFCNREGQQLQEMIDSGVFPVLAVKAGKINDFNGKSIGSISATQLFINPDFPEARGLRNWFDRGGKNVASVSISREIMPGGSKNEIRKTVSQIKDEGLGRSDKPDWVTVKATISFVKTDTFCYTACPLMIGDRQCNKKVTRSGKTGWLCDRCNQEFEECDYRYLLQAQIQDHTGLTWVTAFQESGEEILGCSAKELYLLKHEEQDDDRFGGIIRSRLFNQYLFRLKIKEELYGDEQRVKITIVKADNVNHSSESRYMLDLISKFPR